jgi:hypothetical protein
VVHSNRRNGRLAFLQVEGGDLQLAGYWLALEFPIGRTDRAAVVSRPTPRDSFIGKIT